MYDKHRFLNICDRSWFEVLKAQESRKLTKQVKTPTPWNLYQMIILQVPSPLVSFQVQNLRNSDLFSKMSSWMWFAAVKRSKKSKNLFFVILFLMFLPCCDAILDSSIGGHARHRDYKRIEAASWLKFSQACGTNWSSLMGGKFKTRMWFPDVCLGAYWLGIDFSQQEIEKAREKLFPDFFALKVFYVKQRWKC